MGSKSGGPSSVTVTYYAYYAGMHMVLCAAAEEATLYEIEVNDVNIYSGAQVGGGQLHISHPEIFGGREREGGVVGTLDFMDGNPGQFGSDYLTAQQGTQCAYRGVLSVVLRHMELQSNNPFLKPWRFKVGCIHGTWYPSKARIEEDETYEVVTYVEVAYNAEDSPDLVLEGLDPNSVWIGHEEVVTRDTRQVFIGQNPAHIVYEVLTNPKIGLGLDTSEIDEPSFIAAADTLYDEKFGLSLAWTSQTSLEAFLQLIMDHIGGVLVRTPGTGKYTLFLLRPGQTAAATIQPQNVVRFEEFEETGWAGSVNELTVRYVDIRDGKTKSVTVHNMAALERQGGAIAQSVDYLGLPTQALAERVAYRDLAFSTLPVKKVRLVVDRTFYTLSHGDIVSIVWPDYGLAGEPFRITEIDYGTQSDNEIVISGVTDIYTQAYAASISDTPLSVTTPPPPLNANPRGAFEAPYWFVDRYRVFTGFPQDLLDSDTFLAISAGRPQATATHFLSAFKHGGSANYITGAEGRWSGSLLLRYPVSRTATILTLHRSYSSSLEKFNIGGFARLGKQEIVQVVGFDPTTWEMIVNRGMLDTVPVEHEQALLSSMNAEDLAFSYDVWAPGEAATALALTKTTKGTLAIADASEINLTVRGSRQGRPLPPGGFSINGQYLGNIFTGAATVSWKHRNRLTQTASYQVTQADGTVAPEPNTEYFLRILDEKNLVAREVTLTGSPAPESYLYDLNDEQTDTGRVNAKLTFELWSRRDGFDSWTYWAHSAFRALSTIPVPLTNGDFCEGTLNGWVVTLGSPVARPVVELPFSGCNACQFVLGNQVGNETDSWKVYQEVNLLSYSNQQAILDGLIVLEVGYQYRSTEDGTLLQGSVDFYDENYTYLSTEYGDVSQCPVCGWAQSTFYAASPPGGKFARLTFHAEAEVSGGNNLVYMGCAGLTLHGRLLEPVLVTAVTPQVLVQKSAVKTTSVTVQALVPRSQLT